MLPIYPLVGRFASSWTIPAAAALALAAAQAPLLTAPVLSDEVFTLEAVSLPLPELWRHLQADVHPPLYYLVMKGWLAAFGSGIAALRAFSLIMAATAALLAALALPPGASGRGWAAWFLAANGIVLTMAAYGRMYALLTVLCLLAWTASDRALRCTGARWQAMAALSVAAGLLTHHFFALFLAGLAFWLAITHGRTAFRLLPAWCIGLAVWAAVWGRTAFDQFAHRPQHLAWVPEAGLAQWAWTAGAHVLFVAVALPLGLAAAALHRRRAPMEWPRESRAAAMAALFLLMLPGLISLWRPVLKSRFTIIAAPMLAAALAPLGPPTAGVLPVAAFAAGAAWLWRPGAQTPCTSAEAARVLAAHASASDAVVFCRLTRKPVEYHWPAPAPQRRSFPAEIDLHPGYEGRQPPAQLEQEARALAASIGGRVFVLADSSRPAPQILLRALEAAGFRARAPLLACPSAGQHYFDQLLLFEPPLTTAGSPFAAPPARGSPPPGPAARAYAPR